MKSKARIIKKPTRIKRKLDGITTRMRGDDLVKIGLPMNSADYPDGTSVIMVGTVHEFGSDKKSIPERSFLRSSFKENLKQYRKMMRGAAKSIVAGKMSKEKAFGIIGQKISDDVKAKIIDLKEPSLKTRDGNPLIDTGHLVESITYEVSK